MTDTLSIHRIWEHSTHLGSSQQMPCEYYQTHRPCAVPVTTISRPVSPVFSSKDTLHPGSDTTKTGSLGNDLLSQGPAPQVPSALEGLTSGFGMGPGVPPPLESPREPFMPLLWELLCS